MAEHTERKNKGEVRIQKAIADSGAASRRAAEELIAAGVVTVNGHPAVIGQKVNPAHDIIAIKGEKLDTKTRKQLYYIALNKPRGYVTTLSDEQGRKCVADLVKDVPERVYPIGRLDRNSEGLLLLTNDGDFANRVMHPSFGIGKAYRVTVRPGISDKQLIQLSAGVVLDDGVHTSPAQVEVLEKVPGRVVMQIVITEGRNRQIRRMCEAVGLEVARLKRVSEGPVRLGMLQPGQWRELTPQELTGLGMQAAREAPTGKREKAMQGSRTKQETPRPAAPAGKRERAAQGSRTGQGTPRPFGRKTERQEKPAGPTQAREGWGTGAAHADKKPQAKRVYKKVGR